MSALATFRLPGNRLSGAGGIGLNLVAALWAFGLAMFLRTEQAGAIIHMPVFVLLFLAPVCVTVSLLTGWIHAVARLNPVTPALEVRRGLLAGSPVKVAIAFAGLAGAAIVLAVFARCGLMAAERTG